MLNEILYLFRNPETGSKFYVASEYVTEELMEEFELISISNI
jgi:hypothetical protein